MKIIFSKISMGVNGGLEVPIKSELLTQITRAQMGVKIPSKSLSKRQRRRQTHQQIKH